MRLFNSFPLMYVSLSAVFPQAALWAQEATHEISGEISGETPKALTDAAFGPLFIKMLLLLGSLIAILLVAAWAMKRVSGVRWQNANVSSSIQILERRMLHTKAGLYLIQVEDQKMLAVETPSGFQPLGQWRCTTLPTDSTDE